LNQIAAPSMSVEGVADDDLLLPSPSRSTANETAALPFMLPVGAPMPNMPTPTWLPALLRITRPAMISGGRRRG
jgi:hypothetical protein